jgi:hypothetical protein
MPAEARGRCLALLLLLIPAIAVHGTPSIPSFSTSTASPTSSANLGSESNLSPGLNSLYNTSYPNLARIGKEIFDPPTEVSTWRALSAGARSLPAVPAGLFMVLVGFLCVSFVNDRRIWLTSLAGLLWLGQTGLAAIPEAASHIIAKRNAAQHRPDNGLAAGQADRRGRLRSDVEGTQYIALLRHLSGIPALISSSIPTSLLSLRTMQGYLHTPANDVVSTHSVRTAQCAIAQADPNITNLTLCPACAAEHSVRFSPGFVFLNLARGPPKCD